MADPSEAAREALVAVKRFAAHCQEHNIKVPLWAGILWDEAIGKVNDALEVFDSDHEEHA